MGGFLRKTFGGKDAAKATKQAAETSVEAQREALEYLKQREALPSYYQEQALGGLAQIYGLPAYPGSQPQPPGSPDATMPSPIMGRITPGMEGEFPMGPGVEYIPASAQAQPSTEFDIMSMIEQNPLYSGIMAGQQAGEEAVLRQAGATGGLRSGNVQSNLADFSSDLQNKALMAGYQDVVGGLSGLAGLPSNAGQIADITAGIGATQASGITGAAQAKQQAEQAGWQTVGDLAGSAFAMFSDIRLKDDIKKVGQKNGLNLYHWRWNGEAEKLGLTGEDEGYMAHEVMESHPEDVSESNGYLTINEDMING